MKKEHITLSETDREQLTKMISKGSQSVRVMKRAIGLLALDEGKTLLETAEQVHTSTKSVSQWRDRYKDGGLGSALYDLPRSGRPIEIDGQERAKITALASSKPPEGYGSWSLRLLADKAVELEYCERISHTSVGQILKKTNSNRT
jgi:putative transposase